MVARLLRQTFRSPIPALVAGVRFWRQHGAGIRRARALCQFADGMSLRRVRAWEERSTRLYRHVARSLENHGGQKVAAQDWTLAAHRGLRAAQAPYHAFALALVRVAVIAAAALALVLLAGCLVSPSFRTRIFPRDLAEGQPWMTTSSEQGMPTSGLGPSSEGNMFFHTASSLRPWVEIDLGAMHVIRKVRVENRADCCKERALPLNVEILEGDTWRLIAQRRTPFTVWSYDVGSVRARKIRLLRPGTNFFHLKRISVFGQ
jgi:hypothetical protein